MKMSDENEELIQDDSILCHTVGLPFRKINTVWPTLLEIAMLLCFGVSVFVVPYFCKNGCSGIDPLEVLCYCQSCVWLLVLLFDQFYCWQHNISRMHGYLEFYRKTKISRRLPLYLCSGGCAFLVILLTLFNRYCMKENTCVKPSKVNYLQILVSIEVFLAVLFLLIYLVQGIKFNHRKPSPDVTQDDLFSSFSQNQPPEIGFKDEDHMDEMLEKQADLIRYLKQHNQALGRKIVQLKAQTNKS